MAYGDYSPWTFNPRVLSPSGPDTWESGNAARALAEAAGFSSNISQPLAEAGWGGASPEQIMATLQALMQREQGFRNEETQKDLANMRFLGEQLAGRRAGREGAANRQSAQMIEQMKADTAQKQLESQRQQELTLQKLGIQGKLTEEAARHKSEMEKQKFIAEAQAAQAGKIDPVLQMNLAQQFGKEWTDATGKAPSVEKQIEFMNYLQQGIGTKGVQGAVPPRPAGLIPPKKEPSAMPQGINEYLNLTNPVGTSLYTGKKAFELAKSMAEDPGNQQRSAQAVSWLRQYLGI